MRSFVLRLLVTLISLTGVVAGQSADGLASKVDAVFAQYDKPDSPGCALGVIKDGQIVYARGYGMANVARLPDTIFAGGRELRRHDD